MKKSLTELLEKSLYALEYQEIKEKLKKHTKTIGGKEFASNLKPFYMDETLSKDHQKFKETLQKELDRLDDFLKLYQMNEILPIPEIDEQIYRKINLLIFGKASESEEGENIYLSLSWEGIEYIRIYRILEIGKELVQKMKKFSDIIPNAYVIVQHFKYDEFLGFVEELRKMLSRYLDFNSGEVRDDATETLFEIRKNKKEILSLIDKKLQNIINSPEKRNYLVNPKPTIRKNRYVLAVKSECQKFIKGEKIDLSDTGHTIYIEPAEIKELQDKLILLKEEEKEEIYRIMRNIHSKFFEGREYIYSILNIIYLVDFYLAKMKLAVELKAIKPELADEYIVKYEKARHPLLENPVPIDVYLGEKFQGLIISGPNAGGKTVALKTIGLLTAMALSGLFIPAEKALLGLFTKIFTDIGDEQSIKDNLSTFSAHVFNMKSFLEHADEKTLLLLDELGTGTDPREGEALATSYLKNIKKKNPKIVVATHFGKVKELGAEDPYFSNAYVEFDIEKLQPLYKLKYGGTGKSYALEVAQKEGLPKEIIETAKKILEQTSSKTELTIRNWEEREEQLNIRERELKKIEENLKQEWEKLKIVKEKLEKKQIEALSENIQKLMKELKILEEEMKAIKKEVETLKEYKNVEEIPNIPLSKLLDIPSKPLAQLSYYTLRRLLYAFEMFQKKLEKKEIEVPEEYKRMIVLGITQKVLGLSPQKTLELAERINLISPLPPINTYENCIKEYANVIEKVVEETEDILEYHKKEDIKISIRLFLLEHIGTDEKLRNIYDAIKREGKKIKEVIQERMEMKQEDNLYEGKEVFVGAPYNRKAKITKVLGNKVEVAIGDMKLIVDRENIFKV